MSTIINTRQNPANTEAHQPAGGVELAPGLLWVARLPRLDAEAQRRLVEASHYYREAGAHLLSCTHFRGLAEKGGTLAKTYAVMAGHFENAAEVVRGFAYRSACGLIAYVESHYTVEQIAVARATKED